MLKQNIYTIRRNDPETKKNYLEIMGKDSIVKYLKDLFQKVSPEVINAKPSIDWLLIQSNTLSWLHFEYPGSGGFIQKTFNEELEKRHATFRTDSFMAGYKEKSDIEDRIKEVLNQDIRFTYINDFNFDQKGDFVGYQFQRN